MARNHLLSLSFSVDIYAKSLGEKDFWRSFRYHFKSIAITLKFTKISPVFLYYIIDNQWFNLNYCHFFGGCYQGGFTTVLNSVSWPQMAA